jgi:hypothetical protein
MTQRRQFVKEYSDPWSYVVTWLLQIEIRTLSMKDTGNAMILYLPSENRMRPVLKERNKQTFPDSTRHEIYQT